MRTLAAIIDCLPLGKFMARRAIHRLGSSVGHDANSIRVAKDIPSTRMTQDTPAPQVTKVDPPLQVTKKKRPPRMIQRFVWPPAEETLGAVPAYGAELHAMITAAKAIRPVWNWGDVYDVVKAEFDYAYYLSNNPDIAHLHFDPVAHYLKAGAREGRDPTPWFVTREYVKHYLDEREEHDINPFYHYLTVGRVKGFTPRAPHGYQRFCDGINLDPAEVSDLVRERIVDVRDRLAHGVLGEMVTKAAAIDPLVAKSWPAALRVRVPPASNAVGVRRIAHLLDMQDQAENRRARLVLVTNNRPGRNDHDLTRQVVALLTKQIPATEIVVIAILGTESDKDADIPGVRIVNFATLRPGYKQYDARRSLIEMIRSLRPDHVVNLNATLFWEALPIFGRALSASCRMIHVLHIDSFDISSRSRENVLARFYRAFEIESEIVVVGPDLRQQLIDQFSVPESAAARIHAFEVPLRTNVGARPAGDPTMDAVEASVDTDGRPTVLWIGYRKSTTAAATLIGLQADYRVVAFDPDIQRSHDIGGVIWLPLPATGLPLAGSLAVIFDYRLETLDSLVLDALAAGMPLAARFSETLVARSIGNRALTLPDRGSPAATLTALQDFLAKADDYAARARALRADRLNQDRHAADVFSIVQAPA
jgi:hypothetical protein